MSFTTGLPFKAPSFWQVSGSSALGGFPIQTLKFLKNGHSLAYKHTWWDRALLCYVNTGLSLGLLSAFYRPAGLLTDTGSLQFKHVHGTSGKTLWQKKSGVDSDMFDSSIDFSIGTDRLSNWNRDSSTQTCSQERGLKQADKSNLHPMYVADICCKP